tara:strand:+ start:2130 stop:2327 length:198 start_codon:yes stop_codon:yes gene_type:complete
MSKEKETIKELQKRLYLLEKHNKSVCKLYLRMKEKFENLEQSLIASNTILGEVQQKYNHLKKQQN